MSQPQVPGLASAASSISHPSSSKPKKSKPKPNLPPPPPQPKADSPLLRYPPFPPVPPDAEITPFSQFKEFGIRLHGVPSVGRNEANAAGGDIEVDGVGIPTIALKVRHETDNCKTLTSGRVDLKDQRKVKSSLKESGTEAPRQEQAAKKDPVARALELRRQRVVLFDTKEWYEQWAEGEARRGMSVYDRDLTVVNRIHYAANDFRKGRVWPLSSSGLGHLWDQFRLYAGLLGQPPVWYRTDLQQDPDDVVEDNEDDEASFENATAIASQKKDKFTFDFDDMYDGDSDTEPQTQPTDITEEDTRPPRKRIPPRTPYALHNIVPIALSSQSQVKTLLSIASVRKYQKLESFVYTPDISLRVFFSWYLHHQGFVFSPRYLADLPRLVLFFLEFLLKTKALYESERALKDAVDVTKRAIIEVPSAGRMCKLLPDKMGVGCTLLWGQRWVDEDRPFGVGVEKEKEKGKVEAAKQEAVKKFEEELKSQNVQVVSADKILPPAKVFEGPDLNLERAEKELDDDSNAEISIQVLSPTSPGFSIAEETPMALIEEVNEQEPATVARLDVPNTKPTQKIGEITLADEGPLPTLTPPTQESTTKAISSAYISSLVDEQTSLAREFELNQPIPSRWDTEPASSQDKSKPDAWVPKVVQPLVEIFGMTVLPLKYKAGVVERSMRRVREVVTAGGKSKEVGLERRWRGVQDDLVQRLARVVLEPWVDWDDGGIAPAFKTPRVQIPHEKQEKSGEGGEEQGVVQGEERKTGVQAQLHDPEKDVIVILVEPRVAEQISVGMGLAGTWVQMVRVQDYRKEAGISIPDTSERDGREGSTRSRGRGRGRGRGRSVAQMGHSEGGTNTIDEAEPDSLADTANPATQDANDGLQTTNVEGIVLEHRSSSTAANEGTSNQGIRRGWRGPNRGRGGHYHHHQGGYEEFVFWYVEDILMAAPSFWLAGKEEEPIKMPEGEDDQDLLSDFDD